MSSRIAFLLSTIAYRILFQDGEFAFEIGTLRETERGLSVFAECVHADGQGSLGRQHTAHFALQFRRRLTDERRMVDQTVLGRVVLRFHRAKERLLGTEDLNGGRWMLGEIEQRS